MTDVAKMLRLRISTALTSEWSRTCVIPEGLLMRAGPHLNRTVSAPILSFTADTPGCLLICSYHISVSRASDPNGPVSSVNGTLAILDENSIVLLDPSGASSLTASGNGIVTVFGSRVTIDFSSYVASVLSGTKSIRASEYDITSVPGTQMPRGGSIAEMAHYGAVPTADPLTSLPAPSAPSSTPSAANYSGTISITLQPGTCVVGIHLYDYASVTLDSGICYLDPAPADNAEFSGSPSSSAQGRVDLSSVVEHEMGHEMGFDHNSGNVGIIVDSQAGESILLTRECGNCADTFADIDANDNGFLFNVWPPLSNGAGNVAEELVTVLGRLQSVVEVRGYALTQASRAKRNPKFPLRLPETTARTFHNWEQRISSLIRSS